jgi:hypothetical protein
VGYAVKGEGVDVRLEKRKRSAGAALGVYGDFTYAKVPRLQRGCTTPASPASIARSNFEVAYELRTLL